MRTIRTIRYALLLSLIGMLAAPIASRFATADAAPIPPGIQARMQAPAMAPAPQVRVSPAPALPLARGVEARTQAPAMAPTPQVRVSPAPALRASPAPGAQVPAVPGLTGTSVPMISGFASVPTVPIAPLTVR
ncbi:MAG: hypothetical protein HY900_24270 [Deltaproteobacteria bacterium]|nr:hypothetical protein [Deltaproteobacteria bacterium]